MVLRIEMERGEETECVRELVRGGYLIRGILHGYPGNLSRMSHVVQVELTGENYEIRN
jgi:hypothetical protein